MNSTVEVSTTALGLMEAQPGVTKLMIVLYAIIFLVGLIGNVMVIVVVLKYKSMNTVTNRFIACLSASDLLTCLIAVPFTPVNALGESWIFGEFMCKLVPAVLVISVFVSTFTSVVIAIDRYIVIVYPHAPRMTGPVQLVIVAAIWLLSASTAVPIGIFTTMDLRKDGVSHDCHERWPTPTSVQLYTWLIFALQMFIPGIIIAVCYISIALKLRRQTKKKFANNSNHGKEKEGIELLRNRRINRMLIAMVVTFIICWLPLDLIHLAGQYLSPQDFLTAFLFCHILAMSSIMYNPLLYACLNASFKVHIYKFIQVPACCHKDAGSDSSFSVAGDGTQTTTNFRNSTVEMSEHKMDETVVDVKTTITDQLLPTEGTYLIPHKSNNCPHDAIHV